MRLTVFRHFPLACILVALAACNRSSSDGGSSTAADASGAAPAQPALAASDAVAVTTASPATIPSPAAEATGAAAATGSGAGLMAYVGKYPSDKVSGVSWDEHPAVKAGVRATVTDAAARKAILELEGPASEITLYQGKVAGWACEAHNCGDHQWTVLVDPKTGATDVCYHDAAKLPEKSRWFMAGGKVEQRPGNCIID